jgi:hypothetical protein
MLFNSVVKFSFHSLSLFTAATKRVYVDAKTDEEEKKLLRASPVLFMLITYLMHCETAASMSLMKAKKTNLLIARKRFTQASELLS